VKILIINPPERYKCIENPDAKGKAFLESDDFGAFPPLGALYVLTYLEQNTNGHELYFKDCVGEKLDHDDVAAFIDHIKPDVVGVTSFTISLVDCVMVARTVKQIVPESHVCLGGHHPIAYPVEAAKLKEFDSIVVGEGEYAFTELVNCLEQGVDYTHIQGVYNAGSIDQFVGKQGKDRRFLSRVNIPPAYVEDVDELPIPNRQHIRHIKYHNILGVTGDLATLISSRGCPYLCTFCDVPYKAYRQRSHDKVLDEVQECLDMGYTEFRFYDDLFNITPKKLIEFCEAIEARGMKFTWDFRGRANTVDYESLRKARQHGLRMIAFGVETGTNEGLKKLKKGVKIEKIEAAFGWCRELGIITVADYIIGMPWERNEADIKRSIDFLIRLDPEYAQISVLKLYPNTSMYDEAVQSKIIKAGRWEKFAINPTPDFLVDHWDEHMDIHTMVRIQKKSYQRFYYRPKYIWKSLLKTRSFYELGSKANGALRLLRTNERLA